MASGKHTYSLSDDTKRFLRDHFKSKDVNGDGVLSLDELEDCLKILGFENPSDADLKFLKTHLDLDGNGKIEIDELVDRAEFINFHMVRKDDLMKAFNKYDLDGNGLIMLRELEQVLLKENLSVKEEKALLTHCIKRYDKNGDGKIDYTEFVELAILEEHDFFQNLDKHPEVKERKSRKSSTK